MAAAAQEQPAGAVLLGQVVHSISLPGREGGRKCLLPLWAGGSKVSGAVAKLLADASLDRPPPYSSVVLKFQCLHKAD